MQNLFLVVSAHLGTHNMSIVGFIYCLIGIGVLTKTIKSVFWPTADWLWAEKLPHWIEI